MPQGDKYSYSAKQQRQARHIEEGFEKKGVSEQEAAGRAWATVNNESGGGRKSEGGFRNRKPRSRSSPRAGQPASSKWA